MGNVLKAQLEGGEFVYSVEDQALEDLFEGVITNLGDGLEEFEQDFVDLVRSLLLCPVSAPFEDR